MFDFDIDCVKCAGSYQKTGFGMTIVYRLFPDIKTD